MFNKKDLIEGFCEGWKSGRGSNLVIEGQDLINYRTVIAKRDKENNRMLVNEQYYSSTTTRNANLVRKYSKYVGYEIVDVPASELN